jgi:lipopolysaccharide transport system ATP-binding protein
MSKPIIEIRNLSKKYRIRHQKSYGAFREKITESITKPFKAFKKSSFFQSKEDFWALKDVSFDVEKGEVVGLIGRNGAGKTTLLKVLSRITYPAEGEVRLRGRVGSLLELGTGFNLELTGRENIYFNGAILGMKKREIDRKFGEIVDFSSLDRFLDTPVKRYSSGMKVRLAFSVAAHLEPEILLIDEVLAVGDAEFQKKCLGKMHDVSKQGRTIIFVSHDMPSIRNLCKRVVLLDSGKKIMDGDSKEIISYYLDRNLHQGARVSGQDLEGKIDCARKKDPSISLKEISLIDQRGSLRDRFLSDESIVVGVRYECLRAVNDLRITVQVVDEENRPILITQNADDSDELKLYKRNPGVYRSFVTIPPNTFGENRLYISLQLEHPTVGHLVVDKILGFDVEFQGYNNMHYAKFGKAFLRPCLAWKTEPIGR